MSPLVHIASFRCPAEFDRYRGIADSGKPAAQQVYEFTAPLPTTATAAVWPVFCVQPQVLPWSLRQALTSGDADMSNAQDAFDAVGIVVDWIDACKQQRLDLLLDLYDDAATIECCEGGTFRGRSAMEWYWRSKLAGPAARAFEIDALCPEPDGVSLDYRGYDGKPVRTHFRFKDAGKITLTGFATIKQAA